MDAPTATTAVGASGTVEGTIETDAADGEPTPDAFVAVTVNVYEVPFVRPETVQLVAVVAQVSPPGDEVTVYSVIAAPPLLAGAVHETTDWRLAAPVALTDVGAPGTVEGTTAADAAEAEPVPRAFVAVTVNVYEMPFVRPFTVQNSAPSVTQVFEPGDDVTV